MTAKRTRLPSTRRSVTHKVIIAGITELYLTVGLYDNGLPGELFIVIGKEGSELAGAYDAFGIAVSMLLQTGWEVDDLAVKFCHSRSEPSGFTDNPFISSANSIPDYIFKWMVEKWGKKDDQAPLHQELPKSL